MKNKFILLKYMFLFLYQNLSFFKMGVLQFTMAQAMVNNSLDSKMSPRGILEETI